MRQNQGCNKEEEKVLKQEKDLKQGQELIAEGLNVLALHLAVLMAELLALPENSQTSKAIAAALLAESKFSGQSLQQAAESICCYVERDREQGKAIDYFYWRDAKWREGNAPKGKPSTSIERADRIKLSLIDTLRKRHTARVGTVPAEQQDGVAERAAGRIPAGLRRN